MMKLLVTVLVLELLLPHKPAFASEPASPVWRQALPRIAARCAQHYPTFYAAGKAQNLSPYLLMAIAARESACRPQVRSIERADNGEHAEGLMQILPSTKKSIGLNCNPFDPRCSIWAGTTYLGRDLRAAGYFNAEQLLISYRWGPGGARRKLGREHQQGYVQDVLYAWNAMPCLIHARWHAHCQAVRPHPVP
jgi:soluble lytic murein transglycosylase-like protein